jgi:predicted DNA-binding transcriptional regulator AlpA
MIEIKLSKTPNLSFETAGKEPKLLVPLAYNLDETAKVTGLSKRTIRRLVQRGLLFPSKAFRRLIFARSEIERFLKETTED